MFYKLDTSGDLFLDQTELAAINLDKYEVCIRPFFNSCDTYKDGRVSAAEWCFCFWRESEYRLGLPGTGFLKTKFQARNLHRAVRRNSLHTPPTFTCTTCYARVPALNNT